jgi:hypothetical protein
MLRLLCFSLAEIVEHVLVWCAMVSYFAEYVCRCSITLRGVPLKESSLGPPFFRDSFFLGTVLGPPYDIPPSLVLVLTS